VQYSRRDIVMAEWLKDFASAGLKMKTLSVLLVVFGKETPTTDRFR
jgi:hypothetical protein